MLKLSWSSCDGLRRYFTAHTLVERARQLRLGIPLQTSARRERFFTCLFVAFDAKNLPHSVVRPWGTWVQTNCFFQFSECSIQIACLFQDDSEHVVCVGVSG